MKKYTKGDIELLEAKLAAAEPEEVASLVRRLVKAKQRFME